MKSTTYFAEITNQRAEKYLSRRIHLLARLLASCRLRNFPREFTENCFANQAARFISRGIGRSYFYKN